MRIAIVDDLKADAEGLCADICRWAKENGIPLAPPPKIFKSGEELLEDLQNHSFDIIFLDIYMNGINGMDTARRIRSIDEKCCLIFTTQTPDFAVESYDVASSYYLLKPCSFEKLSQALGRCNAATLEQTQYIELADKSGETRLYLHNIVYTEYVNRRVIVHQKDGCQCSVSMRQRDFAAILLQYPYFCDCMKGILVNLEMVEQLQKNRFLLKNGRFLPISRLKYQTVREQFLEYSYAKVREEDHD